MKKSDIVDQIANKTGIPKVDVLVTIEAFIKEVKDSLHRGDSIYMRGFGSFILKKRAKKIARNINKNLAMEIPEHYIPAFRPSDKFKDYIKRAAKKSSN